MLIDIVSTYELTCLTKLLVYKKLFSAGEKCDKEVILTVPAVAIVFLSIVHRRYILRMD